MAVNWIRAYDCSTTAHGERGAAQWHTPGGETWNGVHWCKFCGERICQVHRGNETRPSGSELPNWWLRHLTIQEWP